MKRLFTLLDRLKHAFDSLSIQTKLIGAYILVFLVPVIVLSNYLFNEFYETTIKDIIKENHFVMESEIQEMTNKMDIMERTAQLTVSDDKLLDYASTDRDLPVSELMEFESTSYSYLQRVLFNNPDIANIHFFVSNQYVNEIWPVIYKEARVKERSWYKEAFEDKESVIWKILMNEKDVLDRNPVESKQTNSYVSFIRKINYPSNRYLGIIKVDMQIEDFFSRAYSNILDRQSLFFILDKHNDQYTNMTTTFSESTQNKMLAEIRAQQTSGNTSFLFSDEGSEYLCVIGHIDKLNVDMVNVISLQATYSKVDHTRNTVILVVAVLLILLAITTFFMQSIVLKKLHILRDSMKKVRKGNFNVDIQVKGGDEVGELAHHFRQMLKKINELIVEAVDRSAATKEAELQSLRNQIDAHFLYNTLENLKMLAEIESQYTISDALTSLGSIMRYNLRWTNDRVQLRHEIQHIEHYISIMNIRYDDKLMLDIEIPDLYMDHEILKMSLQPIVENAVKHGIYTDLMKKDMLRIHIHAFILEESFYVEVTDNGIGVSADKLRNLREKLVINDEEFKAAIPEDHMTKQGSSGIGLRNVNQRIQMYYGYENGLRIESEQGEYTKVKVKMPL
ncbi:cache domain-containing sensor histidine kinase [Paenibacillus sinopodophylli]|uniref:cache domain-containing sensor histidine kinase n=1 Tax=Paenibacillus sinopodophylli TaxID=1837342 RepID=UPI00110CC09A|nr:histidine kinase [Paenibacillus sinopodophylli]